MSTVRPQKKASNYYYANYFSCKLMDLSSLPFSKCEDESFLFSLDAYDSIFSLRR